MYDPKTTRELVVVDVDEILLKSERKKWREEKKWRDEKWHGGPPQLFTVVLRAAEIARKHFCAQQRFSPPSRPQEDADLGEILDTIYVFLRTIS